MDAFGQDGSREAHLSYCQGWQDYQAQIIVGFNSSGFDDRLCQAHGIKIKTDFDLLTQVRVASGQPREYVSGVTRKGYSLQNLAIANLKEKKTGTGKLAPVLWQKGRKKEVIDYCLNDVGLLKKLYFKFLRGQLYDPSNGRRLPYQEENWYRIEVKNYGQKLMMMLLGGQKANPKYYPQTYFLTQEQLEYFQWLNQGN
jgi:hypothetical protein